MGISESVQKLKVQICVIFATVFIHCTSFPLQLDLTDIMIPETEHKCRVMLECTLRTLNKLLSYEEHLNPFLVKFSLIKSP